MDADLLPDDIHSRGIEYLTPCDVHSLRNAYPSKLKYQASMKESLTNSLSSVLKNGSTKFNHPDPIRSFTSLAHSLPTPRSVCIRRVRLYVYTLSGVVHILTNFLSPFYLLSGSACVQAIIGSIWRGSDLDIYCTSDAAPYVRSWLIGQDVQQVFSGYSLVSNHSIYTPIHCRW